ncbi:hypothetical protein ACFVYJ_01315 [Pontibacter sp. JAM-7]|uniref:hypothetical protein n=1 Tax=Pontibacter sp. JAM-7 TaxID=3366581 RepID=UPI003AF58EBB
MISANAFRYMTDEQRQRMSRLGVQARELQRLAQDPPAYPPIPKGLQMAAIMLDFRTPCPVEHSILLFQAGDYKNRYRWMLDNQKQTGLIGWHDAVRNTAKLFRPLINQ